MILNIFIIYIKYFNKVYIINTLYNQIWIIILKLKFKFSINNNKKNKVVILFKK